MWRNPDHLNTPRLIADSTGTTVWRWDQGEPFGNDVPNNNPSGAGAFEFPLRFPGQYFDRETNLNYNYFRHYDSTIGRYVETDPLGSRGSSPYAKVNPLRFEDRFGLEPREPSDVILLCDADTHPDDGRKVPRLPRAACDSLDECIPKCRCSHLADLANCYAKRGSLNIPCQFRAKERLEVCLEGCAAKG
jgi:RHS repeat-associated protein